MCNNRLGMVRRDSMRAGLAQWVQHWIHTHWIQTGFYLSPMLLLLTAWRGTFFLSACRLQGIPLRPLCTQRGRPQ